MSNPSSFIDVHVFDGRWNHDITTRTTPEQKQTMFKWLLSNMCGAECDAINGIRLVVDNIQLPPNYDHVNNVYADDILAEICIKLVNLSENDRVDVLKNIAEQMADMYRLGQCPQGRSTRLIQVYNFLKG